MNAVSSRRHSSASFRLPSKYDHAGMALYLAERVTKKVTPLPRLFPVGGVPFFPAEGPVNSTPARPVSIVWSSPLLTSQVGSENDRMMPGDTVAMYLHRFAEGIMEYATLVQTWEFAKQHAKPPDGLITYFGARELADAAGVTSQGLRKLALLGFLIVTSKSQGGGRVYYNINPNHPPVELLAEEDRKPKRKKTRAVGM